MAQFWNLVRPRRTLFSEAGRAGPRRLLLIGGTALCAIGLGAALTFSGGSGPLSSRDARRQRVDPLPGGLHSTPEQDALARVANTAAADAALTRGESYTPPLDPSVRMVRHGKPDQSPVRAPLQPLPARASSRPAPVYPQLPVLPASFQATPPTPAVSSPAVVRVGQQILRTDSAEQQAYNRQVREMLDQWAGRAPHTDVVLPPSDPREEGESSAVRSAAAAQPRYAVEPTPGLQAAIGTTSGELLVPAGRGIYAHPVLALNSDSSSPVIFQADSGRLTSDRMIGSFSRQGNRLVIRITSVIHKGEPISVDGFAVAPGTMEAGVASGVDQHYLSRFMLPAAAAFVQGLGSAIGSSNSTSVISPFGGVTTTQRLNLDQEVGVGAGVAAANIGSTLNAQAPKGPTVTLDANVPVGVMFLTNVIGKGRE